jgi:DNA-binding NarL/FixJ family response regulator
MLHLYAVEKTPRDCRAVGGIENTVKSRLRELFAKLGIKSRAETVEKAFV